MAEKVSRKELKKPDEFFAFAQRALQWVYAQRRLLISGLVVIILAALAVIGWRMYVNDLEEKASSLFIEAKKSLKTTTEPGQQGDQDSKPEDLKDTINKFVKITEDYPSTKAAILALFFIGETQYRLKQYEAARKSFMKYLDKVGAKSEMAIYALEGVGMTYEAEDRLEEAKSYFRRLVDPPYNQEPDRGLYHLARVQEKNGKAEEARESYQKILIQHPNTIFMQEIQQRLTRLPKVSPKKQKKEPIDTTSDKKQDSKTNTEAKQ